MHIAILTLAGFIIWQHSTNARTLVHQYNIMVFETMQALSFCSYLFVVITLNPKLGCKIKSYPSMLTAIACNSHKTLHPKIEDSPMSSIISHFPSGVGRSFKTGSCSRDSMSALAWERVQLAKAMQSAVCSKGVSLLNHKRGRGCSSCKIYSARANLG